MKLEKCIICFAILTLFAPGFLNGAQEWTRFADSGTTVVKRDFPRGKVVVEIRTATLEDGCAKTCPASRTWAGWGTKQVAVITDMTISINGHSVYVPIPAYGTLFAPGGATLQADKSKFVLKIAGADGAETYFAWLYFDANGVSQVKFYSALHPSQPSAVTHFHYFTIGP